MIEANLRHTWLHQSHIDAGGRGQEGTGGLPVAAGGGPGVAGAAQEAGGTPVAAAAA
jgi:hypothetical protein